MSQSQPLESVVYQGQFGNFTITDSDRWGVIIYRTGLIIAAVSFALGSISVLYFGATPTILSLLTPLYALFALGLGVSLLTIHIYLVPLHRTLQLFWLFGVVSSVVLATKSSQPLALFVYQHPMSIFGLGFLFAALTGIYFKEAFCFNRLETKLLTPLVPLLLLGHLTGIISGQLEQILLASWMILFVIFAARKAIQEIPPDIGDKSVFIYLKEQKIAKTSPR